ncbi:hypothetical protein Dimus_023029, partial [Dionaea muscipula]
MVERKLITLSSDLTGGDVRVKTKKGAYYLPSHLYAVCNFDISLLPIKLNLPMICKPLDWRSINPYYHPKKISDLVGGYLSAPTGEIYDRYRMLSTDDINHFYIHFGNNEKYNDLRDVMNKLQRQDFKINSDWLIVIRKGEKGFVELGYLMARFLADMNINDVSILLRETYMKDDEMKELCTFSELYQDFSKNIQQARYEKLIINLAVAYE